MNIADLQQSVDELPSGLREHVLRVVTEARRLAHIHGVDEERATIAALGHDLMRALAPSDLLRDAADAGLAVPDVERSQPILLHGPLGARLMAGRFGIQDDDVLAAARHHTTARPGMSPLERLVYVADKIEPGKAQEDPDLLEARRLADHDLDGALRLLLDYQIAKALQRGWPLHPDTIAARNELLAT